MLRPWESEWLCYSCQKFAVRPWASLGMIFFMGLRKSGLVYDFFFFLSLVARKLRDSMMCILCAVTT